MEGNEQTPIFGLDIGTRSVVGLLLEKLEKGYKVVDIEIFEHEDRSMLDGQIHNVASVTKVIETVKNNLEKKHGKLTKACVAAAGRSLKTKRAKVEFDISKKPIFDHQDILHLELSAVQKAQYEIAQEFDGEKSINYYCVGYSVLSYQLDGDEIGSLLDQSGTIAAIEVIATFLPKVVIESLIAAINRAGLELEALTLEPIAAINVLIPPTMRRLNVALVDIGAGTSDIAITDYGTVTAYGMVPIAGDEITEAISDHFLLDFPEAELVKRQLSTNEEIVLTDILGFEVTHAKEDILKPIDHAISQLANKITEEILNLNQKPPKAVMLVGGGSMTPLLTKKMASALQLPENRVAIRGIDAIKSLEIPSTLHAGPELVTPIGIAIAAKESPVEYISIKVNEQTIRLFDIKQLTVGDGLLAAGIELTKLYGKPGLAIMVKLNDRLISIPGDHGEPPILEKNGQTSSLNEPLHHGDEIFVQNGADGKSASATVGDIIETIPMKEVHINGRKYTLQSKIYKNGVAASLTDPLNDRDEIDIKSLNTIHEILSELQLYDLIEYTKPFNVEVNGKKVVITEENCITKNGKAAQLQSIVQNGDYVTINSNQKKDYTLESILIHENIPFIQEITVYFNGKPVHISKTLIEAKRDDEPIQEKSIIRNGDKISIQLSQKEPFIFQDIFRFIEFNFTSQEAKQLLILRNESNATFSTPIHTGDHLEIKWVEKVNQ